MVADTGGVKKRSAKKGRSGTKAGDECWEMVGLAIGALKRVDFSQVKIFDFRVRQDFEAEPLLMRFFRDAIVYDSKQWYFFLNL